MQMILQQLWKTACKLDSEKSDNNLKLIPTHKFFFGVIDTRRKQIQRRYISD